MWYNTIYDKLREFDPDAEFMKPRWFHFGLQIPTGLPSELFHHNPEDETWETWEKRMLQEYPIKFRLYTYINDFRYWLFDSQFSWHYRLYWWIRHNFIPRNMHHIVIPRTLQPGYHDARELILHTSMECLTSYMEHEALNVDWTEDPWKTTYEQMVEVYNWWSNIRPNRKDPYESDNWKELEDSYDLEDNEMLKKLIDVRLNMW